MKSYQTVRDMLKYGVLASVIAVAMPELAGAQPTDIDDVLRSVTTNELTSLPYILSAVCYIGGAFMLVSGALSLKKHAENPGSEPMGKGIARLVTGGVITSVPALTGIIQGSTQLKDASQAEFNNFSGINF